MKYFPINFSLFFLCLSLINNSHATGIVSQFLANTPLGRTIYPDQPQTQIPVKPSNTNKNNAYFHIDENIVLKTNDLLTCKVIVGNEAKKIPEFTVNTPPLSGNTIFYTYLPVIPGETCFSIKIRAEKYAYLALSEYPYKGFHLFDIILGITGPVMQSGIRKDLSEEVVKVPTPGIINGKEFREFVITWRNGEIMVIRGTESTPFLYYREPNLYPVNYIGIATFGKPGTWITSEKTCSKISKSVVDSENLVSECWPQSKFEKKTQYDNLIQLQKYFLNQMTNNYEYFNKSINQQNDKELIELYKNELKENYNKVKDIQNEIILNHIKNHNTEELISDIEVNNNFEEIRKLFFQYYSNLQILLNKLNIVENLDSKCNEIVNKPNENLQLISTDEFYQITMTGCFSFKVHKSVGSIRITLTNGNKKSLKAVIVIGENTEMEIFKDFKLFENIKILPQLIFENDDEYNSYWISWNAERILVGKKGQFEEFIKTNNPMDFTDLKYVNVFIENQDSEKQWELEKEYQCPHDIDIRIDD